MLISKNIWYGASATDWGGAEAALEDCFEVINRFSNTFLSVEPILENISQSEEWSNLIYDNFVNWVIVGAETGNRKDKVVPEKAWIDNIVEDCNYNDIPVFMKDSLIPIIGEENMWREFPWQ